MPSATFAHEFYLASYSSTQKCLVPLRKGSPFGKPMAGFMGQTTPCLPFNNTAGETSCPFVLLVGPQDAEQKQSAC